MRTVLLLAIAVFTTSSAFAQAVYHEAFCPSVDRLQMVRMKRHVAEASGLVPASDCHPERVRYLGPSAGAPVTDGRIQVSAYTRRDGTQVRADDRSARGAAEPAESTGARVQVRPYTRSDGTQVRGHTRSAPRRD